MDPPLLTNDFTSGKNALAIAGAFFKQVLRVTNVADSTKYTSDTNCGTITPTSDYAKDGFNFDEADMVIST